MRERSFSAFGCQFPVCARCTGLGTGQFAGLAASFVLPGGGAALLFIPALLSLAFLGIDGVGQFYKKWESTNLRRFVSGLSCGFFVVLFIIKLIDGLIKTSGAF